MELDDEVCLCFHVSKRKLLNFMRIERPVRPAQMSECFGAGTGCGWCRRYIERLFAAQAGRAAAEEPTAEDYAQARTSYVLKEGRSLPPGATPIQEKLD